MRLDDIVSAATAAAVASVARGHRLAAVGGQRPRVQTEDGPMHGHQTGRLQAIRSQLAAGQRGRILRRLRSDDVVDATVGIVRRRCRCRAGWCW